MHAVSANADAGAKMQQQQQQPDGEFAAVAPAAAAAPPPAVVFERLSGRALVLHQAKALLRKNWIIQVGDMNACLHTPTAIHSKY